MARGANKSLPQPETVQEKSKFNRGSIIRIKLQNFMTYDELEIFLGPHLNMVLGPNGAGKSAVVCSIIVGLAGDVALTGRANNAADLVKNGRTFGRTEIELFNPDGPNHIVERRITIMKQTQYKTESKSAWRLNGKETTQKEVREFTGNLNIKVDNLCQFLPQDSVTQFVKMDATELLMNTLIATGDNALVESYDKLVNNTKSITDLESELNQLVNQLENQEVELDRLRSDVRRVKERDTMRKELDLIRQKRVYVNYLEKKKIFEEVRERRKQVVAQINELKALSQPSEQALEDAKKDLKKFQTAVETSIRELRIHKSIISDFHSKIDDLSMECRNAYSDYKQKQIESREREQNIRLTEGEIQSMEAQLASLADVDCSEELRHLMVEIEAKKEELRKYPGQKQEYISKVRFHTNAMERIKDEKQQIGSVKKRKEDFLRQNHPNTAKAAEWLIKNSSKFNRKIYLPMMCEIDVTELKYAKHIESLLPRSDLTAFVCEDQNDLRIFTKCIRDELNINVNIILAPQKDPDEYVPITEQRDLTHLGIVGCLKDFLTAPKPVLSYLCGAHQLHRIPVADNCSEQQIDTLLGMVPKFFVGSDIYVRTISRYDRETIVTKDRIKDSVILRWSVDRKRIDQCRERFLAERDQREAAEKEIEKLAIEEQSVRNEWTMMNEHHAKLKAKHDERKTLQQRLGLKKSNLEKVKSKVIDMDIEKENLQASVKKINSMYPKFLEKLCEAHGRCVKACTAQIENKLLVRVTMSNLEVAERNLSESRKRTSDLDVELAEINHELRTRDRDLDTVVGVTSKAIPGFTRNSGLPSDIANEMEKLPNNEDDLNEREIWLESRIDSILAGNNRNLMSDYKRAKQEQLEKKRRVEELKTEMEMNVASRDTIKNTWLDKLNSIISVISNEYHSFMSKLNYDGDVSLDVPEDDPNNFARYGIQIKVRYRANETLIPLTSMRQSGGERSVATMIYMLALQTVTSVPFRCVDEINQGMDKDNERKVFELIVKTADASASQYFLVSPKLLPNLPYSDKMMIHIVFNGPHCEIDWNESKGGDQLVEEAI